MGRTPNIPFKYPNTLVPSNGPKPPQPKSNSFSSISSTTTTTTSPNTSSHRIAGSSNTNVTPKPKNIFQHKNKRDVSCLEPRIKTNDSYPSYTRAVFVEEDFFPTNYSSNSLSSNNCSSKGRNVIGEPLFSVPLIIENPIPDQDQRHSAVWAKEINGKRHIVTQGDLKYDLGQEILTILPFYVSNGAVVKMAAVTGTIVDINYVVVGPDSEVPRESSSVLSPKNSTSFHSNNFHPMNSKPNNHNNTNNTSKSHYSTDLSMYRDEKEWAKPLTIQNWKDKTADACQTMVTGYKIKLHEEFILTDDEISLLYSTANKTGCFIYDYNLHFQSSKPMQSVRRSPHKKPVISKNQSTNNKSSINPSTGSSEERGLFNDLLTVDYRHVMGELHECKKLLSDIIRKDIFSLRASDFETYIGKLQLSNGVFVRYTDSDGSRRHSGIIHFVVLDHICISPLDIKFVVKCDKDPVRILAISKIYSFDVREAYSTDSLHCFHSLERYVYDILDASQIKDIIKIPAKSHKHQSIQIKQNNQPLVLTQNNIAIAKPLPIVKPLPSLSAVREFLFATFDQLKVYIIKKSLCQPNDLEFCVYENREGDVKIIPRHELSGDLDQNLGFKYDYTQKTSYDEQRKNAHVCRIRQPTHVSRNGYKFTGISLASYVKGLAYPDGQSPSQHDQYVFFHSKDYYEFDFDDSNSPFNNPNYNIPLSNTVTGKRTPTPTSDGSDDDCCPVPNDIKPSENKNETTETGPKDKTFMTLVCVGDIKKEFRDPNPKDVILAVPFVCDKGQYAGKVNLKWFYPDNEFRLLHIFITSKGTTALPDLKGLRSTLAKNQEHGAMYVALLDLYVHGFTNSTSSKFLGLFEQ